MLAPVKLLETLFYSKLYNNRLILHYMTIVIFTFLSNLNHSTINYEHNFGLDIDI